MNEFIRVTDEIPRISSMQKAAILLTELGEDIQLREQIYNILKLTPEEQQKLRTTMEGLGTYNPHNKLHVLRESQVLREALDYGIKKGIWSEEIENNRKKHMSKAEGGIREMVKENPQGIAQILKSWLDE